MNAINLTKALLAAGLHFGLACGGCIAAADIAVFAGPSPAASALADGQVSPTDFGFAEVNRASTRVFAVKNTGDAPLTGLAVAMGGADAGAFVPGSLAGSLAPGATVLLSVDFLPASAGAKGAVLSVASNDPDEAPFEINLAGTGTTLPVVSVTVDGFSVAEDGTDHLRFTFRRSSTGTNLTASFAVGGTATLTSDYTVSGAAFFSATAGTVIFGPTASSVTVTIDPVADAVLEPEESVVLTVTPTGTHAAGLTDGLTNGATGRITNDEYSTPLLFTTVDKTTAGLTGSYVNSSLRSVNEPDWRLTRTIAGTRVDPAVNFATDEWGARASVGITGGTDADWNQFSVQWDGWVEVTTPQRLALASDDGSRMWVDLDGDGVFASSGVEFINNGWGTAHGALTVYSTTVSPGLYRIRIQYEESSGGSVARLATVTGNQAGYTDFDGDYLLLTPWEGTRVAYLTASPNLDPAVMALLLKATDDAYDFYFQATGRAPNNSRLYNGKLTIAQVPTTCGAGCGSLGATGIEILYSYFTDIYDAVRLRHQYSQIPFYELGRNFWFYGGPLAYKTPDDGGTVTTGFANSMRNTFLEVSGLTGTPFNNRPWADHGRHLRGHPDAYVRNPAHDWFTTLRVGLGPADVSNLGGAGLFASLVQRLRRDYPRPGEAFLRDLWTTAGTYPAATTSLGALDNFFLAACAGTRLNLSNLLETSWKMPISPTAMATAETLYGSSVPASPPSETLIAPTATWRYKDDGSNQGTAWKEPGFNDSAWALGPAELGYGEGDEATVVDDSPSPTYVTPASNHYITTYFRHAFHVPDPARYSSLALYLKRDDGAVVYLNGVEVIRDNIAEGPVTYTQPSIVNIPNADEPKPWVYEVPASALVAGVNVLAVEVHQSSASNDDVSFAAELIGLPSSPEIAVFAGTSTTAATEQLSNGSPHPFGTVNLGASSPAQTFTVRNSGVGPLTGLAVSVAGAHPGDFVVTAIGSAGLPGNSTTTFAVTFSPTAAGSRNAFVQIASSDSDEGIFALHVSGTGFSPSDTDADGLLDSWETLYWGTTAGHSATDDFDRDGLAELLELAFGLNPTLPDAGLHPAVAIEGGYLTATITRRSGALYEVQSAGTLLSGQPASFSPATTTVLLDNGATLKVRDNVPYGTPPSRFLRVQVTAAP
jgi:hypothetical protein